MKEFTKRFLFFKLGYVLSLLIIIVDYTLWNMGYNADVALNLIIGYGIIQILWIYTLIRERNVKIDKVVKR